MHRMRPFFTAASKCGRRAAGTCEHAERAQTQVREALTAGGSVCKRTVCPAWTANGGSLQVCNASGIPARPKGQALEQAAAAEARKGPPQAG